MTIAISASDLTLIKKIIRKHLSNKTLVYVFGSRAKGNQKKYSDLDLAIDAHGKKLSFSTITALSSDFEESDLPYKVDIIDLASTDPDFFKIFKSEAKLLSI